MHELSVCQALLTQVESLSREHDGAPVRRIVLRWGPLSGVEPELLHRAFEIARAGGVAGAATLDIETSPARVECRDCDAQGEAFPNKLLCPACGSWRTRVVAGEELLLQRVEFEAARAAAAA